MSLAFNCRDGKKSKPQEIRAQVVRVRADTYHIQQTRRHRQLPAKITKAEQRTRDGAGRRQTPQASGGEGAPRGPEFPKRLPGPLSLDSPALCLSSPRNY